MNKVVREYQRLAHSCGVRAVYLGKNGSNHLKFRLEHKGRTMLFDISNSSSDHRELMNNRAVLRRFVKGRE